MGRMSIDVERELIRLTDFSDWILTSPKNFSSIFPFLDGDDDNQFNLGSIYSSAGIIVSVLRRESAVLVGKEDLHEAVQEIASAIDVITLACVSQLVELAPSSDVLMRSIANSRPEVAHSLSTISSYYSQF